LPEFHFAIQVLRALRRFGLLKQQAIETSLKELEEMGLSVDDANPIERLAEIQTIARLTSLSAADAGYLDLAIRNNMPLATRDKALARAAGSVGILFQA
jgi:predicted nucleic acid-binding protein